LVRSPLTRFAEFIIGRRFAPTRWQTDLSPAGRGDPMLLVVEQLLNGLQFGLLLFLLIVCTP
jgi:hypothetical protein